VGTGINLIDQLRERQDNSQVVIEEERSSGLFGFLKRRSSPAAVPSAQIDARDRVALLLLVVGILIVFGSKTYLEEELRKRADAKQAVVAELQQEFNLEKQKSEKLKAIREEMLTYDNRVAELRGKIQKITDLNQNRNFVVRSVDFLVTEMPVNVWLTKMGAKRGGDGEVVLEGYSMSLQTVSDFMARLESAVFYPNWILEETTNEGTKITETKDGAEVPIPPDAKKFKIKAKLVEPIL
jgi:Tfp pilus assembly protein PilN